MRINVYSALASVFVCACPALLAQDAAAPRVADFNAGVLRATVTEIAAVVSREYMDPEIGDRLAESLRRRLQDGQYASAATPDALAARITDDLVAESQDRHLAVHVISQSVGAFDTSTAVRARQEGVRRTNGGVQRVEILPGNVGYLNLTVFWRLEEARDSIASAMRLLARADALIIDMRRNGGGSPGTVALLMGYVFDQPALPLFDIVERTGARTAYPTPSPGVADRNGRRPVYVLTARGTFSGGEGLAFLLQERARAEVIGERTAGAANAGQRYPVNALFEVTVPNGKLGSAVTGRNWEGSGVTPDIIVPASDAFRLAHSRALQRLIGSAEGDWRVRLERELRALNPIQ